MEKEKNNNRRIWILHGLLIVMCMGMIYSLYRHSGQTYFGDALRGKKYEESLRFSQQMIKDIQNALSYSNLAEKFETGGTTDPDKIVCVFNGGSGERSYTLQDVLDYGRTRGITFDGNHRLIIRPKPPAQEPESAPEAADESSLETQAAEGSEQPEGQEAELAADEVNSSGDFSVTYSSNTGSDRGELDVKTMLLSTLYQLEEYYSLRQYLGIGSSPKSFHYRLVMADAEGVTVSCNDSSLRMDSLASYGRYFGKDSEKKITKSNLDSTYQAQAEEVLQSSERIEQGIYEVLAAVDTAYEGADPYTRGAAEYRRMVNVIRALLLLGGVLLLGMVFTFAAGALLESRQVRHMDSWYMEPVLFGEFLAWVVIYWGISEAVYAFSSHSLLDLVAGITLTVIAYVPAVLGLLSVIRRIRHGTLRSGFISYRAAEGVREGYVNANDNWKSGIQTLRLLAFQVVSIALAVSAGVLICGRNGLAAAAVVFLLLLVNVWYLLSSAIRSRQLKKILERVEALSSGGVGEKLDPSAMDGDMKSIAATVNALDDSLELAVQERTRSERMKTELIANVSHDLRTPLTSIISYVDLIRREKIPNPKVQEYLRVVDEKANRMVTMAESLMDASRAQSGNLKISWERIDLVQMLYQVYGEFQERMEERNLTPVLRMVDPPAVIMADGKILWRVLDNLYTNVCKYAKPGTQVLIELQETAHSLIYTMKNVSEMPLNLTADELTERFIRGDSARTTEGSGLGLSIARSMTEQLHGKFELVTDQEMFRVRLVFSKADIE